MPARPSHAGGTKPNGKAHRVCLSVTWTTLSATVNRLRVHPRTRTRVTQPVSRR